jgi:hypothetical protein
LGLGTGSTAARSAKTTDRLFLTRRCVRGSAPRKPLLTSVNTNQRATPHESEMHARERTKRDPWPERKVLNH